MNAAFAHRTGIAAFFSPGMQLLGLILALGCFIEAGWAQTSPHGPLDIPCQNCHTTMGWKPTRSPMLFNHDSTSFPLQFQHGALPCNACHEGMKFGGLSTHCSSCHEDLHRGELGGQCERCHTPRSWLVPDMPQRHTRTRFPLLGRHLSAPCQACHTNEQKHEFVVVPIECFGCHRVQFDATTVPSHRAAGFSTDCVQCHKPTSLSWGASFDHQLTAFPLLGAHQTAPCIQCHVGNRFRGTPTQCRNCHGSQFTSTTNPNHVAAGFSLDCATCHTTHRWQPATFDHNLFAFRLTGAHAQVACQDCHKTGAFAATPTQCQSCHQNDFTGSKNPSHVSAGFSQDCSTCHTNSGWRPATFDHNKTAFPLTGQHAGRVCADCHTVSPYSAQPVACVSCHLRDFTASVNPPHASGGFSQDCTSCHTSAGWRPSSFTHSTTNFPLTGLHTSATCIQCHTVLPYSAQSTACVSCHQKDYNNSVNPPHVAQGFPTDCQSCHTSAGWRPASFDHNKTAFPLTGLHVAVACTQCHTVQPYSAQPTTCVSCHLKDYAASVNPPHASGGFSQDCASCHTSAGWRPSSFNHNKTNFPLTGLHASTACAQCHTVKPYSAQPTTCVSCHQKDYNNSVNPPHLSQGFPTDCQTCHSSSAWRPATFDHNQTLFPLTGAHVAVTCQQCHSSGVYKGLSTQCVSCHQTDYNNANNPPHATAKYPTDCTQCHTTTAWQPSTFDHSKTLFPLTGGHTAIACAQCHVNNVYAGLATTCYSCHSGTFTSAKTPVPHTGFPTDCSTCHTTNAGWAPSTYSHAGARPRFPQDNRHTGAACAKCHQTATDYTQYCCQSSGCHNNCQGGD